MTLQRDFVKLGTFIHNFRKKKFLIFSSFCIWVRYSSFQWYFLLSEHGLKSNLSFPVFLIDCFVIAFPSFSTCFSYFRILFLFWYRCLCFAKSVFNIVFSQFLSSLIWHLALIVAFTVFTLICIKRWRINLLFFFKN